MLTTCPTCGARHWARPVVRCDCGTVVRVSTFATRGAADEMAVALVDAAHPIPLLGGEDGVMQLVEALRGAGLLVLVDPDSDVMCGTTSRKVLEFRFRDGRWATMSGGVVATITTMGQVAAILEAELAAILEAELAVAAHDDGVLDDLNKLAGRAP